MPSGAATRALSSASGATSVLSGRGRGSPPSQPRPLTMSSALRWPLRTLTVGRFRVIEAEWQQSDTKVTNAPVSVICLISQPSSLSRM